MCSTQLDRINYIRASKQPRKPRKPLSLDVDAPVTLSAVTATRPHLVGSHNDTFISALSFNGKIKGFVFKKGESGIGYYRDDRSIAHAANQMLIEDASGAGSSPTRVHVSTQGSTERGSDDAQKSVIDTQQATNPMQQTETGCATADDRGKPEVEAGDVADSSEAEHRFLTQQPTEDDSMQSDAEQPTGVFPIADIGHGMCVQCTNTSRIPVSSFMTPYITN
jgi:hypothetical protein